MSDYQGKQLKKRLNPSPPTDALVEIYNPGTNRIEMARLGAGGGGAPGGGTPGGGAANDYTAADSTELDTAITTINNTTSNVIIRLGNVTYTPTVAIEKVYGTLTIISEAPTPVIDISAITKLEGFISDCNNVSITGKGIKFTGFSATRSNIKIDVALTIENTLRPSYLNLDTCRFHVMANVNLNNGTYIYGNKSDLSFNDALVVVGAETRKAAVSLDNSTLYCHDLRVADRKVGLETNSCKATITRMNVRNISQEIARPTGGSYMYIGYLTGDNATLDRPKNVSHAANIGNVNDGVLLYGPVNKVVADAYKVTMLDGGGTLYAGGTTPRTVVVDRNIRGPFEVDIVQTNTASVTVTLPGTSIVGPTATANQGDVLTIRRQGSSSNSTWYTHLN